MIEDSDLTRDDLRPALAASEVEAICLLTHDDGEPYQRYITWIADATGPAGELERAVKQADMLDNLRRCARDHDPAIAQYGQGLAQLWRPAEAS